MDNKFAIIVSRFNEEVTEGLLSGALETFKEKGIPTKNVDLIRAPGAFEIPLIAKKLAQTKKYSGVVCLGCVIKGDTAHFEFISLGSTMGIMNAMLDTEVPITFGIITTYNDEQAISRSRKDEHNKGREATLACLETVDVLNKIHR